MVIIGFNKEATSHEYFEQKKKATHCHPFIIQKRQPLSILLEWHQN
jgi:hypothetical protein